MLLYEPTAGVDPKARRDFWNEIHGFAADGLTVLVSTHYMDEAERCHEIAYIAYGSLLAHGTVQDVIASANLETWTVSGDSLHGLANKLLAADGVDMVAPFGSPCTSPGATTRLWSASSRLIATTPASPGPPPRQRWKMSSSI